jgi:hypothetical protein
MNVGAQNIEPPQNVESLQNIEHKHTISFHQMVKHLLVKNIGHLLVRLYMLN